jgi:V/A-type H+-transporting ATPase subunit E
MGKVKDKILKEAENRKKEIEKEASTKIKKLTDEAKKKASDIEEKGKERAKEAEKTEKERILSGFRMELSNRKLNKKNEIMEELKSKVSEEMKKMKWDDYKELVKGLILSASKDGDEEIIPGTLYNDEVKKLIRELNEHERHEFKISSEKGNFEIGVVLSKGKRRVIATLPVLLEEAFENIQEKIVDNLFGSE